jgi:hypothetical protein
MSNQARRRLFVMASFKIGDIVRVARNLYGHELEIGYMGELQDLREGHLEGYFLLDGFVITDDEVQAATPAEYRQWLLSRMTGVDAAH